MQLRIQKSHWDSKHMTLKHSWFLDVIWHIHFKKVKHLTISDNSAYLILLLIILRLNDGVNRETGCNGEVSYQRDCCLINFYLSLFCRNYNYVFGLLRAWARELREWMSVCKEKQDVFPDLGCCLVNNFTLISCWFVFRVSHSRQVNLLYCAISFIVSFLSDL